MTAVLSIDCKTGALRRYESGGEMPRLTHLATPIGGPSVLNHKIIEQFRSSPSNEFAVDEPEPDPTPPAAIAPIPRGGGEGDVA